MVKIIPSSYFHFQESGFYYLKSRYYDPQMGRFINADDASLLGANGDFISYNLFAYCLNNPVNMTDNDGAAPKWWQRILTGVAIIATVSVVAAVIVTSGGAAAPLAAAAVDIAVGALEVAATVGATSAAVRTGRAICEGETDVGELSKTAVKGFADGFYGGAIYSACTTTASLLCYGAAGLINGGRGKSIGKWDFGYQTPNTPGISIATFHGGINGGRSFGIDIDIYNSLHYHTNLFGSGKKSSWIRAHHWEAVAIIEGICIGFSEEGCEW